ncbi:hypothetical protein ACX80E_01080 [Arthrobacter sp. TMN-49]
MMTEAPFDRALVAALVQASRAFADSLEAALTRSNSHVDLSGSSSAESTSATAALTPTSGALWDPLTSPINELPFSPKVQGSLEQRKMKDLVYLSAIWTINVREARGATPAEVRTYAIKAGYSSARGVTAWSKGNGGTYNDETGRWITSAGKEWVNDRAQEFGLKLPMT